ncbi:hypothetical protein [Chryseobacterium sp.]|uniref:hypothetical protein n=1 Tax=Chryseobacterium sp. TaxID=1871047 RepID=UPI00260996E5|nr:hypothetical protein [Chryseobacterium sp.]
MIDYKEIMMTLFQKYFSKTGEEWQMKIVSTMYIYKLFRQLIPGETVTEHDAFEMLQELDYATILDTLYDKVCINCGDQDEGIEPDYEMKESGKVFKWVIFEKV